ncbi:putative pentatricopeptide repeat-containing protein [Ananas comosus]|uniref:Putative pentatricopeptide repeat-containing protein n=1 Tax=Ananas comosus TaxID=4615 RepID=A0A199W5E2_ANACO|nr:putative pentatricopeptide repeat-containing protein [Ananas comosus]
MPSNGDRIKHHLSILSAILVSSLSDSHLDQIHAHILRHYHHRWHQHLLRGLFNSAIRSLSPSAAALRLFRLMSRASLAPNRFTLPFLLNSAAAPPNLALGSALHALALRSALLPVLPVANALVAMYAKCSALPLARRAFHDVPLKDVVTFNSLLGAHARLGADMPAARALFDEMPERNVISWNAMVVGYANAGDLASARSAFDHMPVRNSVSWSAIIVAYCRIGSVDVARSLFDDMPEKNLIAWTAMINGYSQCGKPKEALAFFHEMEAAGIEPDAATMVGVISAAAQLGSVELADWVGAYVNRKRIERNERVLTALVDMHAKCGNVDKAFCLFEEIHSPDAYSYTALINGLASHGHAKKALAVFDRMLALAVKPDPITFIGVLSACSHAGLVEKGWEYWVGMVQDYGMDRGPDHYGCMIDMLGRAGRLEEAHEMVQKMPSGPHAGALGALLAACRSYNNAEIAESVANQLFELEPDNTANYILLSSIYASRGQWEDAARVRRMMRSRIPSKFPGYSWVEDRPREYN